MRFKKKPNYTAVSRQSIKRDFEPYRRPERETGDYRRIIAVGELSSYRQYASKLIGKLVRVLRVSSVGGYICEFVHDEDRQALNYAAGWSDRKKEYLLDNVKFKEE